MLQAAYHWIDEGLVAVPQVCRQPSWGLLDSFGGPLAVGNVQRFEGSVFGRGVFEPGATISAMILKDSKKLFALMPNLHGHFCYQ